MARYTLTRRRASAAFVIIATTLWNAQTSLGTDYSFVQDNDDNALWTVGARWNGGGVNFPNSSNDTALVQQPLTTLDINPATTSYKLGLNGQTITVSKLTVQNATENDYSTQIGNDDLADGNLIFQSTSGNAEFREEPGAANVITSRTRFFSPVTLLSNLDIYQNHNLTFNAATEFVGKLNGAAGITLTKKGAGNLQMAYNGALAVNEGFQGNIVIEAGAIRLIGASTISKASGVTVQSGGQLQIGANVASVSLGPDATLTLNGAGKVPPGNTHNEGALRFQLADTGGVDSAFTSKIHLQTSSRIRNNVAGTTGSLTNVISGEAGADLTTDGGGILIFSGANTYAGNTLVNNGRLLVNNTSGSGVGTGDVTVTGNATVLGGIGSIGTAGDPSNVSIATSNLSPGSVNLADTTNNPPSLPGTLTIFGDLTFTGAGKVNLDLTDAQSDLIVTTGTVTLGTAATLNLSGGFVPAVHHAFTLIDNQGANPISGAFTNFPEGGSVSLGTQEYRLTYLGGTGNDVVLAPFLAGDYNANGIVDAADCVLWRSGGPLLNQVDAPGTINDQDYVEWKSRFGNTLAPGRGAALAMSAVPEPTTRLLALFAVIGLLVVATWR